MLYDRRASGIAIALIIVVVLIVVSGRVTTSSVVKPPDEPSGATALAIGRDTPIASLEEISALAPGGHAHDRLEGRRLEPAAYPGNVCVYAAGPGEICVDYAAGEIPAEALMNGLGTRGYTPRSA